MLQLFCFEVGFCCSVVESCWLWTVYQDFYIDYSILTWIIAFRTLELTVDFWILDVEDFHIFLCLTLYRFWTEDFGLVDSLVCRPSLSYPLQTPPCQLLCCRTLITSEPLPQQNWCSKLPFPVRYSTLTAVCGLHSLLFSSLCTDWCFIQNNKNIS